MRYLINPKRRGRTMATRRKRRATPAQLRALAKARRAKRRKAGTRTTRRKRRRTTTKGRGTVARKRSKRRTTRRRRRSGRSKAVTFRPVRGRVYRRNPRFTVRGLMRDFQQGAIDAVGVVAGKGATRMLANFLPIPGKDQMLGNFLAQGLSAAVVGTVAGNFVPRDFARMMVAGGLAAPVETLLKQVPVVGDFLGDDYLELGSYYMGESLPIGEELPIGEYVQYGQ